LVFLAGGTNEHHADEKAGDERISVIDAVSRT